MKAMLLWRGLGTGPRAGYPGLLDAYDSANMVTNAADDGQHRLIGVAGELGPDSVQGVLANGGQFQFGRSAWNRSSTRTTLGLPGHYVQTLLAQVGLQVGNVLKIARIKCITQDAGCMLNDKMLADTIALFKQDGANMIFMARRSIAQLRTAAPRPPTGQQAPFPTEVLGWMGSPSRSQ